ncbi:2-oxoglutarate and iron-dependent oxygenase domain-containing protein 3 [Amyelois transitella]|uniref:2-oxoglutarate and iron-dependent oxygenase domain-containing protein 3 n=1 Tax=Amyelois transitella TaxID=680683 RepID=UPI0029902A21|nr:2-oxoglutarate and iron-dependent oxygenase domain-containing protein 3 [Amyelois transitella]
MQEIKKRNIRDGNDLSEKNKEQLVENDKIIRDPGQPSCKKNLSLRVFSRMVVISSLLIVVYFSTKEEKIKIFARQTDILVGKGEILECSSEYLKDVDKYEGCFPKECKRFVTDKVISIRETEELLTIAQKELQLKSSTEGITTVEFSNNLNVYQITKEKIKYAIVHHFGVEPSKIYMARPALLSAIKPISHKKTSTTFNNYWDPRTDNDLHKSFHYTAVLYLGDYDKDFRGGRFVFVDKKANKTIEPRKSRLSMFTSGSENRYYIERVTSGIKYSLTFYFTCDKQFNV